MALLSKLSKIWVILSRSASMEDMICGSFSIANSKFFSLTLSTKDLRARGQLLRAFDYCLRSVRLQKDA